MPSDKKEAAFIVGFFVLMAAVFGGLGYLAGYRMGISEAASPVVFDGRVTCSKIEGGVTVCSFAERDSDAE